MLHVIDGTWVPNAADTAAGAGNNFATTIMIINAECGTGTEKPAAQNRIDYYQQFAADLGWNVAGEQLSCATMRRFGPSSSEQRRRLPVPTGQLPDTVQRADWGELCEVRGEEPECRVEAIQTIL